MTEQLIRISSAVLEAINEKWWRDPGPDALRERLGLPHDEADLQLFESTATMESVTRALDEGGYVDDPGFCMTRSRGIDAIGRSADPRLAYPDLLVIAASRFAGDDVFVVLDMSKAEDPDVFVFDWSRPVPRRWRRAMALSEFLTALQ
ncbi:MAG: hypothetical protein U0271_21465 [Polyangiaceae bacterium]